MAVMRPVSDGGGDAEHREIQAAAHDLRNLVHRLTFLADNLERDMPASPLRDEARELLVDTSRRLTGIADRLRRLYVEKG